MTDHISSYAAYMKAQERIRYHEYSLWVDSKLLDERIGIMDVSYIVAGILLTEEEISRLKKVRP